MRSAAPKVIEITKVKGRGDNPPFLPLLHKHLEKERPPVISSEACFNVPKDLLDRIVPARILVEIDSIELCYSKGE